MGKTRFVIPQKTTSLPNLNDPDWIIETKYDGFRAMLVLDYETAYFVSRSERVMTEFQDLAFEIRAELKVSRANIDGEIVSLNSKGYSDRSTLSRYSKTLVFMAFDLTSLGGHGFGANTLRRRKLALRSIIRRGKCIRYVRGVKSRSGKNRVLQISAKHNHEGVVLKNLNDIYTRNTRWLKLMNPNYKRATKKPKRS
jgi:bifunctional non-homologous end joining protein LigD